jgi:hypothetical protein
VTGPVRWRWIVEAFAADETDAQVVADVLEAAVRDERNDPDEDVAVRHEPAVADVELEVLGQADGVVVNVEAPAPLRCWRCGTTRATEALLAEHVWTMHGLDPAAADPFAAFRELGVALNTSAARAVELLKMLAGPPASTRWPPPRVDLGKCGNRRCPRFEFVVGAVAGDRCSSCGQALVHKSGLSWADAAAAGYPAVTTEREETVSNDEQNDVGRRDARPVELIDEPDVMLEAMAAGDLEVTDRTRELARLELERRRTDRRPS